MIYIVKESQLSKTQSPEDLPLEQLEANILTLPHLPRVGEIIRLVDDKEYSKTMRNYYEVTGVLHDLQDEDSSDIYLVVKPYPHMMF